MKSPKPFGVAGLVRSFASLAACCLLFLTGYPGNAAAADPVDVSSYVSVSYTKVTTAYSFLTRVYTSTHTATLVNTSNRTLSAPLHGVLIFKDLVGVPTVTGASGGFAASPYQNYYYDLSGKLPGGSFAPGASLSITVTVQRKSGVVYSSTIIKPYAVVPSGNVPPSADAGAPQTVTLLPGQASAAVTLSAAGSSDSDGTIAGYLWSGTPDPADVQSPTLNLGVGSYSFTLVVTDDQGAQSTPAQVSVTVHPAPNLPPTADAGPAQTVTLQKGETTAAVTLAGSGRDAEANGSIAGYSWSGTPDPADVQSPTLNLGVGSHTFTLIVTDNQGAQSSPAQVTVTVLPAPNAAPVLDPIGAWTATEGELLLFTVSGSDADLDPLIFSAGGLPAGAAFNASTRTFSWTPGYDQAGAHPVTFNVSDGALAAAETVVVTVSNVNRKPALAELPAQTVAEDATLAFALAGSDPDGDALSFSAAALPSGASLDPATGAFSWRPGFSQGGSYTLTFAVSDGAASDQRSAIVTVSDVNRNPGIVTQTLAAARIDRPYGEVIAAVDPDGDTLAFTVTGAPAGMSIGAASGAIDWTPTIAAMGNSYPFTVSVSDGRGGSDSRDYTLSIPDTVAPAVFLNAPREVVPGASFSVSAAASDNVAVTGLSIDSGSVSCSAVDNCSSALSASQAMAPGSVIVVTAQALDAAGNVGVGRAEIGIAAAPDTEPPTVTLSAPLSVTRGQRITLAATATDNQGVASLVFADQAETIGAATPPTTSVQYQVPADAALGSKLPFMVTATDFSNLTASALAESEVVESADDAPPVIVLAAPATVVAGRVLPVTLKVTDDRGVAQVELMLSHRKVSSFAKAVEQVIDLPVPMETAAGTRLVVEVTATDASGNSSTASATATVEVLQGLLTGAVYDDTTGAPLPGAEVLLSVPGRAPLSTATDAKGHYSFVADEGSGTVTVQKSGYSRVDRPGAAIVVNAGRRVRDARLTPVLPAGNVSSVLGGTVTAPFTASGGGLSSSAPAGPPADGAMTLSIPPGSLSADAPVTLTQIGAQGLQGALPQGWSPAAAFLVTPTAAAFAPPAALLLPNLLALPAGSYPLVKWDEGRGGWFGAGSATLGAAGAALSAEIAAAGEYALLVSDRETLLAPAAGEQLAGATAAPLPADTSALVLPQPKIIFYKPGVKSEVGTTLSFAAAPPSGSVVWAEIGEEYSFFTGQKMAGEPFTQDIVLYRFGREARPLAADYFVSPTLDFAGLALNVGTITVTAAAPPVDAELVTVVGSAGGTFSAAGGESLSVPPGAVKGFIPLSLSSLPFSRSGITLPGGIDFVAGATLGLAGNSLALPAVLSLPAPAGFSPVGDLALVRAIEFNGETRLAFVAAASLSGGSIVSVSDLPGTGAFKAPGVTVEGRYLVIDTRRRVGYAGGVVTGIDQAPFAGALVSSETLPLASLSGKQGRYVIPVAGAPFAMSAVDPVKRDRGSAAGTGIVGAFTPVDLALQAEPPSVLATTPAASSAGAALADPVRITFSEPVDPASIVQGNFALTAATGGVPCTLELSSGNSVVTMRHAEPLAPATLYTLAVQGVRDLAGYTMGATFSATFTSLDTNPPPAPPAANLAASIPGGDDTTTVTGTQGSAGLHDAVYIVNLTTGARNQVQVDPDGGFSATIAASVRDRLQLEITSPAGATTTVSMPRFRQVNADGSISEAVGPEGGTVKGPEGIELEVPEGAFANPTLVRIKPVGEAQFPVKLSDTDRRNFSFSGGVELDLGSEQPRKYLNLGIATRGGETPDDQWVVTRVVNHDGETFLHPVDTARVIGNVIRTSSPPCPGVTGSAVYGYLKSNYPVGVVYGRGYDASIVAESFLILQSEELLLPYKLFQPDAAADMLDIARQITRPFCIPVPAGRATVTLNTVTVKVRKSEIKAAHSEIVINNPSPALGPGGLSWRFSKSELVFTIDIPGTLTGSASDPFVLTLVDAGSGLKVLPASSYQVLPSGVAGEVKLKVPIGLVTPDAVFLRIENPAQLYQVSLPTDGLPVEFQISGGTGDTAIAVQGVNAQTGLNDSLSRDPLIASSYGTGRLLLQVQAGTIDPTRAQIDAYNLLHPGAPINGFGVVKVEVFEGSTSKKVVDPVTDPTAIVDGGMKLTFDGDPAVKHYVEVTYEDGRKVYLSIPLLVLKVRTIPVDPAAPARVVTVPVPPRNNPQPVPALVEGDKTLSVTEPADLGFFDPAASLLTFNFSRPMDLSTLNDVHIDVLDQDGNLVQGQLRISNNNTRITFVPNVSLTLGKTYTVNLSGLRDMNGTLLPVANYTVNVTAPTKAFTITQGSNPARNPLEPLWDLAIAGKNPTGGNVVIAVSDLPSGLGQKIMAFSTKPADQKEIGSAAGGGYRKRVHTVENVSFPLRGKPGCTGPSISGSSATGYTFTGNLAIGISSIWNMSFTTFYDITDPTNICVLGGKTLTADPSNINDFTRSGTVHSFSLAHGVATVAAPGSLIAYIALDTVGVMQIDVGQNIPDVLPGERRLEPVYPGSYRDIVNVSDRLVLADYYGKQLVVIDPNLAPVTTLPLQTRPRRLAFAGAAERDLNLNGSSSDPGEKISLLFAGGEGSVEVVDVSNPAALVTKGSITAPGLVTSLDVDWKKLRLFALTDRNLLTLFNISSLWGGAIMSGSDLTLWKTAFASVQANAVKADPDTGDFMVGTTGGLEIYRYGVPGLTGEATYTFYEAKPAVGLDWAHPQQKPIRGAIAELLEDNAAETLLETVNLSEKGRFVFFNAPVNKDIKVRVKAALGTPVNPKRIRVVDHAACGVSDVNPISNCKTMGITSRPFRINAGSRVFVNMSTSQRVARAALFMNMSTNERKLDPGPTYNVRDASGFAILDSIYHAEEFIKKKVNAGTVFPPMVVAFDTANAIGTSWMDSGKQLNINGDIATDTDEYDRVIVLHEWLHYYQDSLLRSDSVAGSHSKGQHVDPTLAFNEAYSTGFAAIMNGSRWYVDTSANGAHGGGGGCIVHAGGVAETSTCRDVEVDSVSKANSGVFSEEGSIEQLYDLYDPADPGDSSGNPTDPDTDLFIPAGTLADTVQVDFKKMADAAFLTKDKKAFNTVVSYLNDVKSLLPTGSADASAVLDLAETEGMVMMYADSYDNSSDRLYNEINVGTTLDKFNTQLRSGQQLSTLALWDGACNACQGNKFEEYIYFKFTAPAAGTYRVTITPANLNWIMSADVIGSDGVFRFYNKDPGLNFPYKPGGGTFPKGVLSFVTPPLEAGEAFFRVNSALEKPSGRRAADEPIWDFTYAPAPFSVRVESTP